MMVGGGGEGGYRPDRIVDCGGGGGGESCKVT
jgi:hypothetical protein